MTAQTRPKKSTNVRTNTATREALRPPPKGAQAFAAIVRAAGAFSPVLAGGIAARAFFAAPARRPTSELEAALLSSAERLTLRVDGGDLAVFEWGEGRPVILLHGWGGSAAQMTPLVGPLLTAGFRVQALDAHGHGQSDGNWASIPRFAKALAALAATHAAGAAVVAHSMGAAATSLAIAQGVPVHRAAFVGPPSDARDWFDTFERTLALSPSVSAAALNAIEARAGLPIAELATEFLGPRVRVPILVVHDENDREVALRHGEAVASSVQGARLVRTQGLGHRRILAAPSVHAEIRAFLTEVAVRSRTHAVVG